LQKRPQKPQPQRTYRPPELLLGADRYGPEVDAWSVGCILAELLGGRPIFPGANEPDQLSKIFGTLGFPREEDWPGVSQLEFYASVRSEGLPRVEPGASSSSGAVQPGLERWCRAHGVADAHAVDLLSRLLSLDPRRRLSAREAATHDYFYEAPRACYPHELPKVDDSHELAVKKRAAAGGGGG
jgi:cyclin-dependent kinase 12/13